MYTFVRTVATMPGKNPEMLAFAHKVKAYFKERYNVDVGLSMPFGGNPNRVAFVSMIASLAEFEVLMGKLTTDEEFQRLIAANAANVIPGSVHDELWRAL